MHKTFAAAGLAVLLTVPATAQTQTNSAELLQRGIFAQETAGDLDGAIKIYHQIVDSHPTQREIAAQAQYRLGMTLLQKGDAASASQEIQRLGWDFPDFKELIDSAKKAGAPPQVPPQPRVVGIYRPGPGAAAPHAAAAPVFAANLEQAQAQDLAKKAALDTQHDAEFDFTRTTTVIGTIKQVQFVNPTSWLIVDVNGGAQTARVALDSPNTISKGGWTRETAHAGDQVTIIGAPARDGSSTVQATSVTVNGAVVFSRSNVAR